ncbi:ABC transporter permease [Bacillota bacterium Meth-B3]|nr:ABC transporter permease [Christensenellaceae bacterium]MEA5065437.1 ABC transporter permease [Eubacteriales bacterium]MEA5068379.1 ABC transporter permease [Christensenellaceae bacterium]
MKRLFAHKEASVLLMLLAVMLISFLFNNTFLSFENLMDVIKSNAVLGICAMGMLLVIITGGIDVSIGGQLALITVLTGQMMKATGIGSMLMWYAVGIAMGALLGLANGLMVSRLQLPPIIATLGLNSVIRGFLRYYTNGTWINQLPDRVGEFGMFKLFAFRSDAGAEIGVPIQFLLFALAMAATWFLIRRTMLGRSIMAMGASKVAAERIGLNTHRLTALAYVFSGMMAGFAAITYTSIMKSVDPNAFIGYDLNVIGAVVLGGALLSGGSGSVPGTFLGVMLFGVISNGLTLARISAYWQSIIVGTIILVAVSFDMIKLKREEQRRTKVDIEVVTAGKEGLR